MYSSHLSKNRRLIFFNLVDSIARLKSHYFTFLLDGPQPSVLQKVTVPIWSNQQCRQKYGSAAPGGIVDHMICAGKTSMDSCSGDSGGK